MSRRRPLSGFWRDKRGVSAVEFALIAPVMIIMYCGLAEVTQAMMAQRRLSNIASQIGDLVAQSSQTGPTKMTDVFTIGSIIMAPFPTSALKMCVASITSDATGKDTVAWSRASASGMSTCPAQGTVLTVPVGVLPASQSVIMARASYAYASPIKLVMPRDITFQRTFYLRPRKVDTVIWSASS
ncbi:Flp pilus assembly protein TadG [Caulobacter sp. BE264]|jgi:Flp pilus assembly protein TadG|uniref:TadE/TadG family type IV pilus assembly protein n=1 Tax=Caulobacter sp. BE264 TaxID=2817724 RepID=UPI00285501FB|nr:pilus assembly protein [Caulobacter sp. BE264]MDR7230473.1 Flp pilus assembly protein TadG [Caulobacter sp. BE264]